MLRFKSNYISKKGLSHALSLNNSLLTGKLKQFTKQIDKQMIDEKYCSEPTYLVTVKQHWTVTKNALFY